MILILHALFGARQDNSIQRTQCRIRLVFFKTQYRKIGDNKTWRDHRVKTPSLTKKPKPYFLFKATRYYITCSHEHSRTLSQAVVEDIDKACMESVVWLILAKLHPSLTGRSRLSCSAAAASTQHSSVNCPGRNEEAQTRFSN